MATLGSKVIKDIDANAQLNEALDKQDLEFILTTLETATIKLKDLQQAVITIAKIQRSYKSKTTKKK